MLSRFIARELGIWHNLTAEKVAGRLSESANRVAQESGGADCWRRDRHARSPFRLSELRLSSGTEFFRMAS